MKPFTKYFLVLAPSGVAGILLLLFAASREFSYSLGEAALSPTSYLAISGSIAGIALVVATALGIQAAKRASLLIWRQNPPNPAHPSAAPDQPNQQDQKTISIKNLVGTALLASVLLTLYMTFATFINNQITNSDTPLLSLKTNEFLLWSLPYQTITSELFLRLFTVSVLSAALLKIRVPKTIAFVAAVLASAALSFAVSIPLDDAVRAPTTTHLLQLASVFLIPHIVFGILFWKKSLVYAMATHGLVFLFYDILVVSWLGLRLFSA